MEILARFSRISRWVMEGDGDGKSDDSIFANVTRLAVSIFILVNGGRGGGEPRLFTIES